ncbi:MAG: TatD family hydrolase [Dehalococcoidia bacterium]
MCRQDRASRKILPARLRLDGARILATKGHSEEERESMVRLIETHAHVDELGDHESAIREAQAAGVLAIVAVGSSHESNVKTLELAQRHAGFVFPALGLHPWGLANLAPREIDDCLQFVEENLAASIALGEIGLDYDKRVLKVASKDLQKEVLIRLLGIARDNGKPVVIHSRYAWKDALQIVRDAGISRAVFHWFTGFSGVLKDIIDAGYLVSATPAAEYHEEHRRAVSAAPLERLLLETDCPVTYGRETRYQSRPVDILRSMKAVSELKGVEQATVAAQTTANAVDLFSLDITF